MVIFWVGKDIIIFKISCLFEKKHFTGVTNFTQKSYRKKQKK